MRSTLAVLGLVLGTSAAWAGGPETLAYWAKVNEMLTQADRFRSNYVDSTTPEMRRDQLCRDLLALPTEGVDRDVLALVRQLVAYAPVKAKADAVKRWYHFTGYGLAKEITQAFACRAALAAEAVRVQKECEERYGVSFPAFHLPNW
ncbi:MAG: hypothetical protein SNJ82_12080 [Gemmataceae bacterium]